MDSLILTIESHTPEELETQATFEVTARSVRIGRRAENDWVLPDPTRHISGQHFDIVCEGGQYVLQDKSTNGTFINGSSDRVSGPHRIANGDRIRVGPYLIHARLRPAVVKEEPDQARPFGPTNIAPASPGGGGRGVQTPPSVSSMAGGTGVQIRTPGTGSVAASGAQTPDFKRFEAGSQNAARVSAPPNRALSAPPVPVAEDILSDPIDDILAAFEPSDPPEPEQSEMEPPPEAAIESEPEAEPGPAFQPIPETPSILIPDDDFALGELDPFSDAQTPPEKPTLAVSLSLETQAPRGLGEAFSEPTPAPKPMGDLPSEPFSSDEPLHPAAVAETAPAQDPFLEGFLKGAGLSEDAMLLIPLRELGEMLGKCVRLGTHEMMQMLQDRSAVKLFVAQEDRTMRVAAGNNPMKFMTDPDQAFETMFVTPRDGYLSGEDAFENALNDIRRHQMAMMAAVQPAMADMLAGLDPDQIEADAGGGGILNNASRKCWEEYAKRWNERAAEGENGMVDAFVKAFARRYSEAINGL